MSALPLVLPQLVARGGNAAEFPQNSLPSLRSALEMGARHVGFDVQLTADHIPVLLQSDDVGDQSGSPRDTSKTRWEDLAAISLGETQRFGKRFSDVGIPSLGQAAELLSAYPNVLALIEINSASLREFGHQLTVRRIVDALHVVRRQCVIVASDLTALHFTRLNFDLPIGWLLSDYSARSALKAESFAPNYLVCDHQLLPAEGRLWRGPWCWVIYDVASRQLALEYAARGASLIETTAIRTLLREFRELKLAAG